MAVTAIRSFTRGATYGAAAAHARRVTASGIRLRKRPRWYQGGGGLYPIDVSTVRDMAPLIRRGRSASAGFRPWQACTSYTRIAGGGVASRGPRSAVLTLRGAELLHQFRAGDGGLLSGAEVFQHDGIGGELGLADGDTPGGGFAVGELELGL